MILDKNLLVSSSQNLTVTAVSTDVVDLANARDLGPGTPIRVLCQVAVAFATTNAATLQVQVQGSTDNSTYSTYAESRAYAVTECDVIGTRLLDIDIPRPSGEAAIPRYLRMRYVVGTGDFTPGAVTAAFVLDRDDIPQYPSGFAVAN